MITVSKTPSALAALTERRSVPSVLLSEPGPTADELQHLVAAALRVPDHGRLEPWRLISVTGDARLRLGALLVELHRALDAQISEGALEKDRMRFSRAPLVLVVVGRVTTPHKVPEIEQMLSAGCVAYNLLLGAQALGFGAQWLTGWAAYDASVHTALGVSSNERIIGFIHIGTPTEVVVERARPVPESVLSNWPGQA